MNDAFPAFPPSHSMYPNLNLPDPCSTYSKQVSHDIYHTSIHLPHRHLEGLRPRSLLKPERNIAPEVTAIHTIHAFPSKACGLGRLSGPRARRNRPLSLSEMSATVVLLVKIGR